jgi:hypothetical protein
MMAGTVDGLDDLDESINDLVRQLSGKELLQLTSLAGDEIMHEVAVQAPILSGDLKASIEAVEAEHQHSASVQIQVANSAKNGIEHYAVFVEYGHVITRKARTRAQRRDDGAYKKVKPHPFMRPAFDAAAPRAVARFTDGLNRILVEKQKRR